MLPQSHPDMAGRCRSFQLITGEGTFNKTELAEFSEAVKLREYGLSYFVIAIMGPQSSGKSTLLNRLFGTNFREMNTYGDRVQTTRGVWLAAAPNFHPCTLVVDLEGADGRERESDTAFEKQSALFALAISDVVMINTWCNEIGRETAANRPLLKTVFQVMLHLIECRKKTLLFVIRDISRAPLEILQRNLTNDVINIWNSAPKPAAHRHTPFHEFFDVKIEALPNYEHREEDFKTEVDKLKTKFSKYAPDGILPLDRTRVVPPSGFQLMAQQTWDTVKSNKFLSMTNIEGSVAAMRCSEIARETFQLVTTDRKWQDISEAGKNGRIEGFGRNLVSRLNYGLSRYDKEAEYFDAHITAPWRKKLESDIFALMESASDEVFGRLLGAYVGDFAEAFEKYLENGGGGERFNEGLQWYMNTYQTKLLSIYREAVADTVWDTPESVSQFGDRFCTDADKEAARIRAEFEAARKEKRQRRRDAAKITFSAGTLAFGLTKLFVGDVSGLWDIGASFSDPGTSS